MARMAWFADRQVTPLEHAYYDDPAFIASLHPVVPSTLTTMILKAVRGVLFVLAMLPVIAVQPESRWYAGLCIALIGAVLEPWIPLSPSAGSMPTSRSRWPIGTPRTANPWLRRENPWRSPSFVARPIAVPLTSACRTVNRRSYDGNGVTFRRRQEDSTKLSRFCHTVSGKPLDADSKRYYIIA